MRLRAWLVCLLVAAAAVAQSNGDLPLPVEAALLKKVFLFTPGLDQDATSVLLVHGDGQGEAAEALASSFGAIEVRAVVVAAADAASSLAEHQVVYLFPGADGEELLRRCAELQRLTVSGSPALAEGGRVSVAVGLSRAGNPEIVVHRRRLEEEGHELPPRLLRLARLVE